MAIGQPWQMCGHVIRTFPQCTLLVGIQVGWDEICASWENLAKICSNGRVELRDRRISLSEDLAYETGPEHVNVLIGKDKAQADLRVSSAFRRRGSEWRMVQHHVESQSDDARNF